MRLLLAAVCILSAARAVDAYSVRDVVHGSVAVFFALAAAYGFYATPRLAFHAAEPAPDGTGETPC